MAEADDQGNPESAERQPRTLQAAQRAAELSRREATARQRADSAASRAAAAALRDAIGQFQTADAARRAAQQNYEAAQQLADRTKKSLALAQFALERARAQAENPKGDEARSARRRLAASEQDFERAQTQALQARALLDRAKRILSSQNHQARILRRELIEADEAYRTGSKVEESSESRLNRQSEFLWSLLDEPARERLRLSLKRPAAHGEYLRPRAFPEHLSNWVGLERDRMALMLDRQQVSTDFWISVLRLLAQERPELLVQAAGELIAARAKGIEIHPEIYRALGNLLHSVAEQAEAAGSATMKRSKGDGRDDGDW
ncbi:hypothetical protein [Micromonospora coerulea]|uniref:hypothetical protein n=1 Tax=Micromonospora coerulea TaxID=47856 RepID=UPI00190488D8|nr:hypothetical protein [Micromonospora veneta]